VSSSNQGRAASYRPSLRFASTSKTKSGAPKQVGHHHADAEGAQPAANLADAAREVVASHLAGTWPELKGRPWLEVRSFLLCELLRRHPGFSTREYRRALSACLSSQAFKRHRFT